MIKIIYFIILTYFVLGGLGFYLINREKSPEVGRKSYTKFGVYFIIIHILFFSIVIDSMVFRYLSVLIILAGFWELVKLFRADSSKQRKFFGFSLFIYAILAIGFYFFSGFEKELLLFSFLILSIFDSFSQITGQLFGRKKILPNISPNKTLGGVVGGAVIAIASAFLLRELYNGNVFHRLLTATGVVIFAFAGDVLASLYKRKFNVKDFSNLIPGHGGFLDRFDSLIAGGAGITFSIYILGFW